MGFLKSLEKTHVTSGPRAMRQTEFLSLKEKARTPLQVLVLWASITFIFTDLKENMGTSLSQSDSQDLPSGPAAKNPAANVEAMCLSPGPGSLHRERSP